MQESHAQKHSLQVGEKILAQAEPYIFAYEPEEVRTSVFAMKQRTNAKHLTEDVIEWRILDQHILSACFT